VVVLKAGWLNRQFDQVSKNVDSWPAWMKRAAGFDNEVGSSHSENAAATQQPHREDDQNGQQTLSLKV
jgi:hypothetical protein